MIETQPSAMAAAGMAFGTQPVIYVEDQYGNLETGDNSTQVTAASLPNGSGPLGGTTTVTVSGGIATFTDLSDAMPETITLHFTSSPTLTAATSNSILVARPPATQLVISTQPSGRQPPAWPSQRSPWSMSKTSTAISRQPTTPRR